MVNPFKDTNWNPDNAERRKFARSLVIGFPALAAVMFLFRFLAGKGPTPGLLWLAVIGAAAGAIFWIIPQIAKPFYLAWYFLACCIGIVVSNTLLSAFFYLVVTPTGLVMRLLGHDPMKRKFDPAARSYWVDVEKPVDLERYFRQY